MKDSDLKRLITDPKAMDEIIAEVQEDHYKDPASHKTKRLTMDEIRTQDAIEYYNAVSKHPATGHLHRKSACALMARLELCSEDWLVAMAQVDKQLGSTATIAGAFQQIARVILKKRGLQLAQGWA